jgi:hypothetical protein
MSQDCAERLRQYAREGHAAARAGACRRPRPAPGLLEQVARIKWDALPRQQTGFQQGIEDRSQVVFIPLGYLL